ncbi:hypothetical protein ACFX13_000613 [Malus domestica]
MHLDENEGRGTKLIHQILNFRQAIGNYNLGDLGSSRGKFTWMTNCHGGNKEHLDRVLTTFNWKSKYHFSMVHHLLPSKFDHISLLLEVRHQPMSTWKNRPLFHFKEMWTSTRDVKMSSAKLGVP